MYRFRIEHIKTNERKSINCRCSDPGNVIKVLFRYGWLVQIHYQINNSLCS
jgi:hypothetical protein